MCLKGKQQQKQNFGFYAYLREVNEAKLQVGWGGCVILPS
jgi:hypothetical protein